MKVKEATLVQSLNVISFLKRKKQASLSELRERFDLDFEELIDLLNSLCDVGIPPYGGGDYIQVIFEAPGYVRLGSAQHFRGPVRLTLEEITALRLWLVSTSAGGQPWRNVVQGLLEKIEDHASAGSGLSMDLDRLREVERRSQTLTLIDRALKENCLIKLEYFSTWRDKMRYPTVASYGLVDRQGVWVLVGQDQGDLKTKDYRIDRIRQITLLSDSYPFPEGLDLDAHVQVSLPQDPRWPRVTVRAQGPLRRELEQIGENCREEGAHLLAEVVVASVPWFLSWLLSHPDHLDLIDPGPLNEEFRNRLDSLQKNC